MSRATCRTRTVRRFFGALSVLALVAAVLLLSDAARAEPVLEVTITSHPYLLLDSNKPGVEGPVTTTVFAKIANTGTSTAENVYVHIGDGATPGSFPAGSNGKTLAMLGGSAEATRYVVHLAPGESKAVFWQLTYPSTAADFGQTYPFMVWADNEGGYSAQDSHTFTIRSALSSAANSLLGTVSVDPSSGNITAGGIVTVTLTGFDFGMVGSGPNNEEDIWMQPIGNLDFDPTCFRLIRTEAYLHSIENVSPYGSMPYLNELYFPGVATGNPVPNYSYDPADYVKYYFIALKESSTSALVYQEAASGNTEKYSSDYATTEATVTLTGESGGLSLVKSVAPSTASPGDTVRWTATYSNSSNYPLGDPVSGNGLVVIDEGLPEYTTYVPGSAASSGSSIIFFSTDNTSTWTAAEPPAAQVTNIKWYINEAIPANTAPAGSVWFDTTINSGTPDGQILANVASAGISGGDPLATDTASAVSLSEADLSVTKSDSPDPVVAGNQLTYTIVATNNGGSDATGVMVTDVLPAGVTFVSATPTQGSYDSGTGQWTVGALANGASATLTIVVQVDSSTTGILSNTATIAGDQTDLAMGNNADTETTAIGAEADLSVTKSDSPDPVCAGNQLTYTIVATNNGGSDGTGVVVSDVLPAGVTFVSATPTQGSYDSGTGQWTVGGLANGASATLTIVVQVDSSTTGILSNTATIAGDQTDPAMGNNTATEDTSVYSVPSATAASNSPVCEGSTIAFIGGPDGMASYSWTGPNGFSSSQQSPTIANANPSMAGTYQLTVVGPGGCADSTSIVVTVSGTADSSIDASDEACANCGGYIASVVDAGAGATYDWVVSGGVITSGQGTPSITWTAGASGVANVGVTVTNSAGCSATSDVDISITPQDTPIGTPVAVNENGATVTFSQVTAGGCTYVVRLSQNPAGPVPPGISVAGNFVEIWSTATYSGVVSVCMNYDESVYPDEIGLRFFHWNGTTWEDVTTSVDTETNTICGQVDSLSPFFAGWPFRGGATARGVPAIPSTDLAVVAALGVGLAAYFIRRRLAA